MPTVSSRPKMSPGGSRFQLRGYTGRYEADRGTNCRTSILVGIPDSKSPQSANSSTEGNVAIPKIFPETKVRIVTECTRMAPTLEQREAPGIQEKENL